MFRFFPPPQAPYPGVPVTATSTPQTPALGRDSVPDDELVARLAQLPPTEAAALLLTLPEREAGQILGRLSGPVAGMLFVLLPLDAVVRLLATVPPGRLPTLLAALCRRRSALARTALAASPGSAARLLSDAVVQATAATPAGIARAECHADPLVGVAARELFVVDGAGRLLGHVPRQLLDQAPSGQPVGELARPVVAVGYGAERDELAMACAASEDGVVAVVRDTGQLLGLVWTSAVAPVSSRSRVGEWTTNLLVALILVTLMLAGLSTLDPPLYERFNLTLG